MPNQTREPGYYWLFSEDDPAFRTIGHFEAGIWVEMASPSTFTDAEIRNLGSLVGPRIEAPARDAALAGEG